MGADVIQKDLLSELFSTLRIRSNLYFKTDFRGAYAIEIPKEKRRIRFHLVLQGQCWLRPEGEPAIQLSVGDVALVPNGHAQVLSHKESPGYPAPIPLDQALERGALRDGVFSNWSDELEGEKTLQDKGGNCALLCGYCHFDEDIDHPVLINLPKAILLRQQDLGAEPWMAITLRLIALETELAGQGASGVLSRLIEIILIQQVRRLNSARAVENGDQNKGFMAALSDLQLSKVLSAIHEAPQKDWTVASLAICAGMSRTRFAEHFTKVVGMAPIAYLTLWRLIRARYLLSSSQQSIEDIALKCGYASVPSFSSRFKREFGQGPGAYRKSYKENEL